MADDNKVETDRLKVQLAGLLRRVPASVNAGNHGMAVAYKKAASVGNKLLASSAPRFVALQQAISQLSVFQ